MTTGEFRKQALVRLSAIYDDREADAMVRILYGSVLGLPDYVCVTEPDRVISCSDIDRLESCMKRLEAEEPLQYVLGEAEFYGLRFNVSPAVLIPRPETEFLCRLLVEDIVPSLGNRTPAVLDLCTGSGCIAWTIAHYVPGSAVTAADVSEAAVAVASSQNIAGNRPEFRIMDVLGSQESIRRILGDSVFDIIVSNPPYVTEGEKRLMAGNVLNYEPEMALFVPDDDPLLFYRAIASIAAVYLSPGGLGAVEINESYGRDTCSLFSGAGFRKVSLEKDLSGRDRFVFFGK